MLPMPTERRRRPRPSELPAKSDRRAYYDPILIVALLMGRSTEVAAQLAGISRRTVVRRQADPEFQRKLAEAREDAYRYVTDGLKNAAMLAVGTLVDIMQDPKAPHAAKVTAASRVLELTMARRYEVTATSVTVNAEVSAAGKVEAFLATVRSNTEAATRAIEATLIEEPHDANPTAAPVLAPSPPGDQPIEDLPDPGAPAA
jgi:hypothetical protein